MTNHRRGSHRWIQYLHCSHISARTFSLTLFVPWRRRKSQFKNRRHESLRKVPKIEQDKRERERERKREGVTRCIAKMGSFLERPGNFSGPKANFKIKTCWIIAQFLAHKPVNFASLIDSFIVLFSNRLKLWSWMQTQQTQNRFPGPKSCRDFREPGPRTKKSPKLKEDQSRRLFTSWPALLAVAVCPQ